MRNAQNSSQTKNQWVSTDAWNKAKTRLLNGVDQVCGWTHGGRLQHAETWEWNDDTDQYIKENWRLWKLWKMVRSKEDYLAVKKVAQETRITDINTDKDCNKIFKLAKKMKVENTDVIGNKCVKDKDNNLVLGDKEKLHV